MGDRVHDACNGRAERILREKRLKVTPQRMLLLTLIDEMGHAGVDELYEAMRKVYSSLSLATVYKNVNALMRENVITELAMAGEKNRYEIAHGEHAHFVCEVCGQTSDVESKLCRIRTIFDSEVNGELSGCDLVLKGVCPDCENP